MLKLLKISILFLCITGFSQTKVGTIDVDLILSKMPEIKKVQTDVEAYGKQLDSDLSKKIEEYQSLVDIYKTGEANFTDTQKTEQQKKIIASENDINAFQQNATKLINLKRDEVMKPLYNKIRVALDKIALQEGYTQILQLDASIVFITEKYDITKAVITELGLQ